MLMTPFQHQIDTSVQALEILNAYGIVYLGAQERTCKSITGLLTLESHADASNIIIITQKSALEGWNETLGSTPWKSKEYTVTNYHGAVKLNPNDYDAVILDEAHNHISSYPKRSLLWRAVAKICGSKPIVYMSATPYAQGIHLLFNQLAVSAHSPWAEYKDYYKWYYEYAELDEYGQRLKIYIKKDKTRDAYGKVQYDKAYADVKHIFITKTRKELGFKQEPIDVIHNVELSANTKAAYNHILTKRLFFFEANGKPYMLAAKSIMKLRTSLHMLEGGVLKIKDEHVVLNNREKIDYILEQWGDNANTVIMYHYIAEGLKLKEVFKQARCLQSNKSAEGIDLSHIDHLIIYSQSFSTAKYSQRRARQANMKREDPIEVHFINVEKGISKKVYITVAENKVDYVDSLFKAELL